MKGFGFIPSDRDGKDIFVHASALERAGIAGLTEGQRVAVDVIDGRKGPEAAGFKAVELISPGDPPEHVLVMRP
jgi:cold shock CspA family protein